MTQPEQRAIATTGWLIGTRGPLPPTWLDRAAKVVLILAAGAVLAVLARALTRLHRGISLDELVTFYLAPAVVAAALIGGLKLAPERRINVALLVLATGAGFLIAEAVLLLSSPEQRGLPAVPSVEGESARSLYDVVLEQRSHGDQAFPRVPGNVLVATGVRFRVDTEWLVPLGPAPGGVTVALCIEGGRPVLYRSDRFGFNNPDSLWNGAPVDVALVGDSYTVGVCVAPDDQLAAHLSKSWHTVNLGMSGAGPLRELAILREFASLERPSVVVWVYYEGNDLSDLNEERSSPLVEYLNAEHRQNLGLRRAAVASQYASWLDSIVAAGPSPLTGQGARRSVAQALLDVPRLQSLRELFRFGVSFPNDAPPLGLLPDVLRRAKADVESWGGRLLLVYLPAYARYQWWLGDPLRGRDEVMAFARDEGVPLVDLDAAFTATGDPRALWAHARGHLNPTGYRVAAEAIARAVDSLTAGG